MTQDVVFSHVLPLLTVLAGSAATWAVLRRATPVRAVAVARRRPGR